MKRRYAQGTRILLPSAHGIKDRRDDGLKDREFSVFIIDGLLHVG